MFQNIGGKIKGLAKALFVIGTIIGEIFGVWTLIAGEYFFDDLFFVIAPIAIIGAPIIAWVSSLTLYGFGELIDRTISVDEKMDIQAEK